MRVKTVKWYVSIGLMGERKGAFDMPDDATREAVEAATKKMVLDSVNWGWVVEACDEKQR